MLYIIGVFKDGKLVKPCFERDIKQSPAMDSFFNWMVDNIKHLENELPSTHYLAWDKINP